MLRNILKILLIIAFGSPACISQNVEIIDGWYYIDGQKFFIKGIGYETHTRPGQVPWIYSFDPDLIEFDLNRMKNAGFNTIRTWGALSEEELQIIEGSGLKILFGIWIDPHGDFSNPGFVTEAYNHVNDVLDYSSNYNSIIGYLIMNEPQVQHIYDVGAQSLSDLWSSIVDLIHLRHTGIPVSFSNTIIGDYIDMQIFDVAAYNAYIYNPVTITKSHGYYGYLNFLKENRANQMPFIITEYGLSVSPGPVNNEYGYGGNSLEQQKSGNLLMYRELIDAGAQGNCVFQYHDGWWKGGNEYIHDPNPEEWFGLVEFSGLGDNYGTTRPVWAAYETYNKAIISNPKNGNIYNDVVPIELFLSEGVSSGKIFINDSLVFSRSFTDMHYTDELNLTSHQSAEDKQLDFYFFDSSNDTIKSESISILYTNNNLELPELNIELLQENLLLGGQNYLMMQVTKDSFFTIEENRIDYVVHPHIGFDAGTAKSKVMTFNGNTWTYFDYFDIPEETKVATFGAGFTIKYGEFRKRIFDQEILLSSDWADPIVAPELITGINPFEFDSSKIFQSNVLFQNYPNPLNPGTTIQFFISEPGIAELNIYDSLGQLITSIQKYYDKKGIKKIYWNSESFPSGVYFYRLQAADFVDTKKMILLR